MRGEASLWKDKCYEIEYAQHTRQKPYDAEQRPTLGGRSQNRLDASAARIVYQRRGDHSARSCFAQSVAQGTWFRHAYVDLLHQSRREGTEQIATSGVAAGEGVAFSETEVGGRKSATRPEKAYRRVRVRLPGYPPSGAWVGHPCPTGESRGKGEDALATAGGTPALQDAGAT